MEHTNCGVAGLDQVRWRRRARQPGHPALRAILPLTLLLASCGAPTPEAATDPPASGPDTIVADAPLWRAAGVDAQPRLDQYRRGLPPELGYSPGTTPWRAAELELPDGFMEPQQATAPSPGALLQRVVGDLGVADLLGTEAWEHTSRIWQEDEDNAVGVLLRWGLMDDAIVGHDLRFHLRRSDEGWRAEAVEQRFHCARGVTAEGLCV